MIALDSDRAVLLHGDSLEELNIFGADSMDSCVTDPPYELGFMGKKWDASGIAFSVELWAEVYRILKPGAHLLAFGGTRTYHRMTCAIEDAGFEIRDCLTWNYKTGFPKSLNLGEGRGTALKPALEPIVLARKPFRGTVAANVAAHGTGSINVDGARVLSDQPPAATYGGAKGNGGVYGDSDKYVSTPSPLGRWPANSLFDDSAPELAKYFFCAKPTRAERDLGCADLPAVSGGEATDRADDSVGVDNPRAGAGRTGGARNWHPTLKPLGLMEYLVRLVTPAGGTVLDPFVGSGTTGMAALRAGFSFVGVEKSDEYLPIAIARLLHAETEKNE